MVQERRADEFALDPQLAGDAIPVGDLPLCHVRLMNDAHYPWLILVPRRAHVTEIIDLNDADQAQLTSEIAHASHVLRAITACDKLNVAAIGNMVAQLHVHVVGRRHGDLAWPKPVWGAAPAKAYEAAERSRLVAELRKQLGLVSV